MSGLLCLVQKMPVQTGYCLIRGIGIQVRRTGPQHSSPKRWDRSITLKRGHVRNDRSIHSNKTGRNVETTEASSHVAEEQEDLQ